MGIRSPPTTSPSRELLLDPSLVSEYQSDLLVLCSDENPLCGRICKRGVDRFLRQAQWLSGVVIVPPFGVEVKSEVGGWQMVVEISDLAYFLDKGLPIFLCWVNMQFPLSLLE